MNGEAIYESSPWQHQNDSRNANVWYTCRKTSYDGLRPTSKPLKTDKVSATYAIFLKWPTNNVLEVKDLTPYLHSGNFAVGMLGKAGETLNVSLWYYGDCMCIRWVSLSETLCTLLVTVSNIILNILTYIEGNPSLLAI